MHAPSYQNYFYMYSIPNCKPLFACITSQGRYSIKTFFSVFDIFHLCNLPIMQFHNFTVECPDFKKNIQKRRKKLEPHNVSN